MRTLPKTLLVCLIAGFNHYTIPSLAIASGGLSTVFLGNTAAQGTAPSVEFTPGPALNDNGQTAFIGSLAGTGVDSTNNEGLFSEGAGTGLVLIAREGSAAPGTGADVNFKIFNGPALNNSGQTAFHSHLAGAGANSTNDSGVFGEDSENGLALLAREGDTAPGTTLGVNFSGEGSPVLNSSGKKVFRVVLTGTGVNSTNNGAIYSEGAGSGLTLVAREGNAAPGTALGVRYINLLDPVLNDSGHMGFHSDLVGPGVGVGNNEGFFSDRAGNGLELVFREGDVAPGTGTGVYLGHVAGPTINNNGQIAFRAGLIGAGVDSTSNEAIYSEGAGNGLALVARTGFAAPGTSNGVNFSFFCSLPVLNSSGQIAFVARITGTGVDDTNYEGLFSEGMGNGLELVARMGSAAPGTAAGVNFGSFNLTVNHTPVLNSRGQTAFGAGLTGTGVDSTNDQGIFAVDLTGNLQLVVREGNLLDVSDNPLAPDLRVISRLGFLGGSGNEDGRSSGFNDLGQLAFSAEFTDGTSGIFVSDLVAVPEPSSVVQLLLAGLSASACCVRKRLKQ